MRKGSGEAPFMNEPSVSTIVPSDSARWMTTNMEYGKFYRSAKQEEEERKSLHTECQKRCEALTKELRDCQAQLELLRLRTFSDPTAEERPAASAQAYRSARSRSISPRSYLEDHLKANGCRRHVEKESEAQCELVSVHSGKVKDLERKEETFSDMARDIGRKEQFLVKARDLEKKEENHFIKKKDLGRKEDNFQMGRKEEHYSVRPRNLERQEESYSGKKKDLGKKEDDFPEKSRDMGRKEEQFAIKPRDLGGYQGNQALEEHPEKNYKKHHAMDSEAAATGQNTRQMDHSERSLLKPYLFSKKRIPVKRGPHEDMERMYPNKRKMFEHGEKQLIQNQAPPYINPATSRYNFYKYYGYAGQGAKTSWRHNRPLGLEPPYAAKASILPLGQEPPYSPRARGFHN